MLRRLLTLLTVLTLACASAHAYVPERSLLQAGELASQAKTAPRGFAARAEPAAKEKSGASDCCIRENWHPPLKLASSMQFTGHYREREGSSYYAQQRYYRPGLGRFNRIDPWSGDEANPITLNKYLYANGNPLIYVDPDGLRSVSTMIEDAAEGCGPVSCAGWAMLYGAYHVGTLGFAGIHDPARDAYSAGEIDGTQYATHTAGALAITAVSATGVGSGARVVAGATTAAGRVGAGAAFGAATGGGLDAATQGLSIATGVQEGYDLNRTRNATLMGGALGFGAAGAGHLVQTRQQASALSAEVAARRVVRTPSDGAEQSAVQQAQPVTLQEGTNLSSVSAYGTPDTAAARHADWGSDLASVSGTIERLGQRALRRSGGNATRSEQLFDSYLRGVESRLQKVGSEYGIEIQPAALANGERVPGFVWLHRGGANSPLITNVDGAPRLFAFPGSRRLDAGVVDVTAPVNAHSLRPVIAGFDITLSSTKPNIVPYYQEYFGDIPIYDIRVPR
jgi:RHS repeat-associated protein